MSELHFQEPTTFGKILIKTSKGDIVVELWSRECPKACRNFVQQCLEGYYHGCIFHRIIKDFIAQTGDPHNTGDTCESIYSEPFPDEIHPRLRFRYRGCLGVASRGKGSGTNGSQFFITLSKQDILNGQHTLFGKLVGDSVYTLVDIADVEVDRNDKPLGDFPPIIVETVVLENPFSDIVLRVPRRPPHRTRTEEVGKVEKVKITAKKTKILSFTTGDDDEEEAGGSGPMVSAHDIGSKSFSNKTFVRPEPVEPSVVSRKQEASKEPNAVREKESSQDRKGSEVQSESLLSEIERVKAAIKAATVSKPLGNAKAMKGKESEPDKDQMIMKKLKTWSESVSKSKTVVTRDTPQHSDAGLDRTTLSSLLKSAEGNVELAVTGSGWLKTAGPIKFAIDSKNAFNK